MAEIFLARAQAIHGFEKQVVLKRILPQHASSDDFIRMFLAEARLAATLHHPNIVQVYDIGEELGTYFFTMEWIQGQDLRRIVRAARKKQTPIPLAHILHIIMGMAGGLHHAHEKNGSDGRPLGIVHRDVSPSNVLVTYEGDVKVVDFGIAKAAAAQVSTIAGTLKGKIPYMSPEQCRGEAVDRRSDIFSIGTLLWELTTGKRLFAGENEFAILNRVAKADVPPPSSIRPEYPPELEAIVMRALSVNAENRYPTAIDLQIDLEDFAREARLPVSSARMGRFMRQLFDEEIKHAAAELAHAEASASEVPGGTMVVSPSTPPEGISDLTPSEVRQHAAPTPGIVADTNGSNTDIHVADPSYQPRKGRAAAAIAAGFVLTLGLGGGLYMMSGGDDDAEPTTAPASVPTVLEAPAVEPDPADIQADAAPPIEPAHERGDAGDGVDAPNDLAEPAQDTAAPEADAAEPVEVVPDPPEPEVTPEPKKPKATRTKTKKRTTRTRPEPKPPEPDKKTEKKKKTPKYNADSARLPGF